MCYYVRNRICFEEQSAYADCSICFEVVILNTVQPIRDKATIKDISEYLRYESERNYVMFMFGIYSGLRISDILKLRVRDVRNKKYIYMREKKTGKEKRFIINKNLKQIVDSYINGKKDYEYLFRNNNDKCNKAISRQQAYNILSEAGKKFGLDSIGTHTLRKTFGYHFYQQTHDAVTLMEIFNHADISITLRYIGINQDNKDKLMSELSFN